MPLLVTSRIPASPEAIECIAEGWVALNYLLMDTARRMGGGFPALYESGIVYRREPPRVGGGREERWQLATDLLRSGHGDCEDLCFYRAAELRVLGEPATVAIERTPRGSFHAVVRRGDGSLEDPSRILLDLEQEEQEP